MNDLDENTPVHNVINIKPFVNSTNERLSHSERKLANISDDVNHILNVSLPVINNKLDSEADLNRKRNGTVNIKLDAISNKLENLIYAGLFFIVCNIVLDLLFHH